ncbi:hypothetical protein BGX27_001262 [Mortierella sp. AM989]|nr:hypothetical protein BGX27_001262 [Mortierella sp. AM989]
MVCTKCEKKLAKIICPDKWKDGARNTTVGTSSSAGRKLGENKLLKRQNSTHMQHQNAKHANQKYIRKEQCTAKVAPTSKDSARFVE